MKLDEIKAREANATKGPWGWYNSDPNWLGAWSEEFGRISLAAGLHVEACATRKVGPVAAREDANREFIAHARSDIPWLVSEVERLTSQNAELARGTQALVAQLGVAQRRVAELEKALRAAVDASMYYDGEYDEWRCPACNGGCENGRRLEPNYNSREEALRRFVHEPNCEMLVILATLKEA